MFGLEIPQDQLTNIVGAVVTGVLALNAGIWGRALNFMKTESAASRKQAEAERTEARKQSEMFVGAMKDFDSARWQLVDAIVKQRDADIHRTQEIMVALTHALGRVERVLDRHETTLNRNGH